VAKIVKTEATQTGFRKTVVKMPRLNVVDLHALTFSALQFAGFLVLLDPATA
jgi:hypothetical protein